MKLVPPLRPARADRRRHAGARIAGRGRGAGGQALGRGDPARRAGWHGGGGAVRRSGPGRPCAPKWCRRRPGQPNGLLDLGGFYGLHPSLANLHTMFKAGELLPVHAVVGPTRVRSHFEAQDCLESGADHRMTSGWLNRAVAALPGAAHGRPEGDALAIGVSVPLLLRGPATVGSWAPHGVMAPAGRSLHADRRAEPRRPRHRPGDRRGPARARLHRRRDGKRRRSGRAGQNRYAFPALARAAGEMLRAPDGPRVAALEIGGWDTHQAQVPRLAGVLKQLDARAGGAEGGAGAGVAADRGAGDDRVRPHRPGERHQGHRPRHRHGGVRAGRRGGRRARRRPGRAWGRASCTRTATWRRRPICGRWPRGCWRRIWVWMPVRWVRCSPAATM